MPKYNIPRGTRDFPPGEMDMRNNVIRKIENIFKVYDFRSWDGPAFEHIETLRRKAGPSVGNEIYTFKDKADRELGLRFELTTSLARIIANNPDLKKPIKAYSIGKVWRYENPQQGRYREFLQADVDIFGSESMACESELLLLAKNVMDDMGFNDFKVRLNNRKVLYAQISMADIPEQKSEAALRSLDKLDKLGHECVKDEFIRNGLTEKHFTNFMDLILKEGDNTYILNKSSSLLAANQIGWQGLEELKQILRILEKTELKDKIYIAPSLVRGLDYYTGPIFEIEISSGREVGSVAGGGRYDKLVGLFGGQSIPAVGISFGIERIIDLIKRDAIKKCQFDITPPVVQIVYQNEYLPKVLEIAVFLRSNNIKTSFDLRGGTFKRQFELANRNSARYAIIIGEEEVSSGYYSLKDLENGKQDKLNLEGISKILNIR